MAYIREIHNKKGISYRIEVSNGYDKNGRKIRATTTFVPDSSMTGNQQQEALRRFADEYEKHVKGGFLRDVSKSGSLLYGNRLTLAEFTREWVRIYADNHLEKSTLSRYLYIIERILLPNLGQIKLSQLKPYQIEAFYVSLTKNGARMDGKPGGYAHGTIRKTGTVLSAILKTACRWEIIDHNPCYGARLPKGVEEEKLRCYTAEQICCFLQFLDRETDHTDIMQMQYLVLFRIAIFGGLRRGEILGLTWDHVDYAKNGIYIEQTLNRVDGKNIIKSPKTKSSVRFVALPSSVMALIQEYQLARERDRLSMKKQQNEKDGQDTKWIFIQKNGMVMSIGSPYAKFHRLLYKYNKTMPEKMQLPVLSLHDLRHTNASLLVHSNQIDTKTISRKLGHASMATTMKYYIHAYEESERKTADILEKMLTEKKK